MEEMDNRHRISNILKKNHGSTMLEIILTVGLTGILAVGIFIITKNKSSMTAKSSSKYASLIGTINSLKAYKKEIGSASDIKEIIIDGNKHLEITLKTLQNQKIIDKTIRYSNDQCDIGTKTFDCLIKTNLLTGTITRFPDISNLSWCRGGPNSIGECLPLSSKSLDLPETDMVPAKTTSELSSKRFITEFKTRTGRVISLILDLNNLDKDQFRDNIIILR